jgi:hypothetical protein
MQIAEVPKGGQFIQEETYLVFSRMSCTAQMPNMVFLHAGR